MPSLPDGDLAALVRRREAEARAAHAAEVERILGIADPAERMRAYAALTRGLEEGEALPAEATERILRSLREDAAPPANDNEGERRAAQWQVDRRRLATLFFARPVAAAGCLVAALLPFIVAAWRHGLGEVATARGLVCMGLAGIAGALLARRADRAESLEGLAALLVAGLAAGVVALAVAEKMP